MPAERTILLQAKEKLYQQSRINETIQKYKAEGISESRAFFHEKENALLSRVRSGNVQEAKALLNRFVDAIALFVITYCAIPVIVVLVMVWVVKFLFQVQIPVPQKAMKPFAKNKKIDAEETALVEV